MPREFDAVLKDSLDDFGFLDKSERKVTLVKNGQILACFGMVKFWKGSAEFWACTSKLVEKYPVFFHRQCVNLVNDAFENSGLSRIQATVQKDHARAIRWIVKLGFVPEGLMRKYYPTGEDAIRFAYVR